jgi:plasmid replication initiation protein
MPKRKALVVQANSLVEARYRLTNLEQRLIFSLISKLEKDDDDLHEYDISLKELSQLMGIDLADAYNEIAKITRQLMTRVISIKLPSGNLLHIHWICRAEHRPGSVALSFMPDLKPYLLHLKSEFTICELETITKFSGKYTIRIYMLLRQYSSIGWREFDLAELREILGIEEKEYSEYKEFARRVIAQAKKEMDAVDESGRPKADFSFKIETIKEGRKITRIKFILVKNKKKQGEPAMGSIGQAVEKAVAALAKPAASSPPPIRQWRYPEHWSEFLQYIEKEDPGLLPIIASDGPEILIVKHPYRKWLEEVFSR